MEFPPRHYQVSLFLTRKEKLPKCQEIPINSAGGKKKHLKYALSLGGCNLKKKSQTGLAAIDYLGRKRHSGSSFHSKIADFVLPVTLSSATPLQTATLFYKGSDPKPTNRNAQERC